MGSPAVSNRATDDDRNRRRWLLLSLLLLLLLIGALIAFVSCDNTSEQPGPAGATPGGWRSAVATFVENPLPTSSPSEATVTMPDVVGLAADDADMSLRGMGFVDITFVDADGHPAALLGSWVVTRQSVKAGVPVPASQPIVLTVQEKTTGRG